MAHHFTQQAHLQVMANQSNERDYIIFDMVAAAGSTAISNTAFAPLERIKLLLQTQALNPALTINPFKGPVDCFKRIVRDESLWALWRGNMASIYPFFPTFAWHLTMNEQMHKLQLLPADWKDKVCIKNELENEH